MMPINDSAELGRSFSLKSHYFNDERNICLNTPRRANDDLIISSASRKNLTDAMMSPMKQQCKSLKDLMLFPLIRNNSNNVSKFQNPSFSPYKEVVKCSMPSISRVRASSGIRILFID